MIGIERSHPMTPEQESQLMELYGQWQAELDQDDVNRILDEESGIYN